MRAQRPGRFPDPPTEHQGTGLAPLPAAPATFPTTLRPHKQHTEYSLALSFASVGSRGSP